jgi:hypothetical protein
MEPVGDDFAILNVGHDDWLFRIPLINETESLHSIPKRKSRSSPLVEAGAPSRPPSQWPGSSWRRNTTRRPRSAMETAGASMRRSS